MAAKRKPRRPQKAYCLVPWLHGAVTALLEEDDLQFGFHGKDNPSGCVREEDSSCEGRFVCRNDACRFKGRGWYSVQIATTIRMYPGAEYNARVYKQRCQHCEVLGHLVLDSRSSYTDRVAYLIKKWCGLDVVPPKYDSKKDRVPHDRERCEGCQAGHCIQGQKGWA